MKITIDHKDSDTPSNALKIEVAHYVEGYVIQLRFSDGKEKRVDFKPFLSKSLHPSIAKYLDKDNFTNFSVVDGNLNWNNYDLIFPIEDLYFGRIEG